VVEIRFEWNADVVEGLQSGQKQTAVFVTALYSIGRGIARSIYTLKQPEFTQLGWRLRNAAVGVSRLTLAECRAGRFSSR
jgi:hypothetical protein